jgi:hypothetical protein
MSERPTVAVTVVRGAARVLNCGASSFSDRETEAEV